MESVLVIRSHRSYFLSRHTKIYYVKMKLVKSDSESELVSSFFAAYFYPSKCYLFSLAFTAFTRHHDVDFPFPRIDSNHLIETCGLKAELRNSSAVSYMVTSSHWQDHRNGYYVKHCVGIWPQSKIQDRADEPIMMLDKVK